MDRGIAGRRPWTLCERRGQVYYNNAGQVWMCKLLKWQYDGEGGIVNQTPLAAKEYRYDSGRQRYLVRPRSAGTYLPYAAPDGAWSD